MRSVCVYGEHTLTLTGDALHTLVTHTHVPGTSATVPKLYIPMPLRSPIINIQHQRFFQALGAGKSSF